MAHWWLYYRCSTGKLIRLKIDKLWKASHFTHLSWFCWLAVLLSCSSASIRLLSSPVISFISANLHNEIIKWICYLTRGSIYFNKEQIRKKTAGGEQSVSWWPFVMMLAQTSMKIRFLWFIFFVSLNFELYLASIIFLNWSVFASFVLWSSRCFTNDDIWKREHKL